MDQPLKNIKGCLLFVNPGKGLRQMIVADLLPVHNLFHRIFIGHIGLIYRIFIGYVGTKRVLS